MNASELEPGAKLREEFMNGNWPREIETDQGSWVFPNYEAAWIALLPQDIESGGFLSKGGARIYRFEAGMAPRCRDEDHPHPGVFARFCSACMEGPRIVAEHRWFG